MEKGARTGLQQAGEKEMIMQKQTAERKNIEKEESMKLVKPTAGGRQTTSEARVRQSMNLTYTDIHKT